MVNRRKSAEIKSLRGTFRKDRDGDRTEAKMPPVTDIAKLKRPEWLDDDAVAAWDEVLPLLIEMGVITFADRHLLIAFVCAVSRLKSAEREIEANGLIVQGSTGPKKNPAVSVSDESMKMIRGLSSDLGLTPASRPGLNAKLPEKLTPEEQKKAEIAKRLIHDGRIPKYDP